MNSIPEPVRSTFCITMFGLLLAWGTGIGLSGNAVAQVTSGEDTTAMGTDQVQLQVAQDNELGAYLTDGDGRALYLFKADTDESSTCYDQCADVWPPLVTQDTPQAADSAIQENLLGTTERQNGDMQVTYNGWPLYYFARDTDSGQTQGQDVEGFGAEWYLISPDGSEVHAESEEEGGGGPGN